MAEPLVALFVAGVPVQQGSKIAVMPKGARRPVVIDDNSKTLRPWRKLVKAEAERVWRDTGEVPIDGPVQATVVFVFPPVASDPDRHWCAGLPDIDKLERALYDGLTDGKLWVDDRLVVKHLVSKRYAEAGEATGVHVAIDSLADHERLASARRHQERTRTR